MSIRAPFGLGAGILFISLVAGLALGGTDSNIELESRFRSEYPAAAGRLAEIVSSIECEAKMDSPGVLSARRIIKASESKKMSITNFTHFKNKPTDRSSVLCLTPNYYFQLEKPNKATDYTMKIVDCTGQASEGELLTIKVNIDSILNSCFSVAGIPLSKIVQHKSFKINKIEYVRGFVRLDFACDDESHWIGGGKITLDPNHDWVIVDSDVNLIGGRSKSKLTSGSHCLSSIEFKDWGTNLYFAKNSFRQCVYENGDKEAPEVYEFEKVIRRDIPDAEFRPSFFRLPDSLIEPATQRSNFPIYVALNGLFVILIVGLHVMKRLYRPT